MYENKNALMSCSQTIQGFETIFKLQNEYGNVLMFSLTAENDTNSHLRIDDSFYSISKVAPSTLK